MKPGDSSSTQVVQGGANLKPLMPRAQAGERLAPPRCTKCLVPGFTRHTRSSPFARSNLPRPTHVRAAPKSLLNPAGAPLKAGLSIFPFLFVRSQPKEGRSIAIQIHEPVHGDHHANENQDHSRRDFYLARMRLEPLQEPCTGYLGHPFAHLAFQASLNEPSCQSAQPEHTITTV